MKRPHMRFDFFTVTKREPLSGATMETQKIGHAWYEVGKPVVVASPKTITAPTTDVCFKHDCDHEVVADESQRS